MKTSSKKPETYDILVLGSGEAGEIMASVQVAMFAGLPYTTLRDMIFTHPTLSEGLVSLFSALPPAVKS